MSHRHRVLIVDDDPELREIMAFELQEQNCEVEVAVDGRDALERLKRDSDFCVILLDLNMPVMSGEQFRKEQLKDLELASIPVVVVSAEGANLPSTARTLHVNGCLSKPPQHELLARLTDAWCAGRRQG